MNMSGLIGMQGCTRWKAGSPLDRTAYRGHDRLVGLGGVLN